MNHLPELDPKDQRSKNQQIAAVLRQAIESGDLRPGDRVPGENVLMDRYGVARWTAREALAAVANLGLITKIPKVGTFVADRRRLERRPRRYRRTKAAGEFATEARAAGMNPRVEADSEKTTAPPDIAERLKITIGSAVMRTHYRFLANERPIQTSISYEPLNITEGTAVEVPEDGPMAGAGVIARMDSIGVRITHVSEEVAIRPPFQEEADTLEIPAGVQVFDIWRTLMTDGRPVEVANIIIPGDRYVLAYQFTVPDGDSDPATI